MTKVIPFVFPSRAQARLISYDRCWTKNADYWTVYFDLNERMVKRFEQEGIQIPFNTLDVNILPAAPAAKLSKAQDKPSSKAASPAAKRSGSKSSAKKPTSDKK